MDVAHRRSGKWKVFVALYSSRVPGLTQPLLDATVRHFCDLEVAIEVGSLADYEAILAAVDDVDHWLRDWFGHPVAFSVCGPRRRPHLRIVR